MESDGAWQGLKPARFPVLLAVLEHLRFFERFFRLLDLLIQSQEFLASPVFPLVFSDLKQKVLRCHFGLSMSLAQGAVLHAPCGQRGYPLEHQGLQVRHALYLGVFVVSETVHHLGQALGESSLQLLRDMLLCSTGLVLGLLLLPLQAVSVKPCGLTNVLHDFRNLLLLVVVHLPLPRKRKGRAQTQHHTPAHSKACHTNTSPSSVSSQPGYRQISRPLLGATPKTSSRSSPSSPSSPSSDLRERESQV
mmetsp:Transcript_6078/g.18172  ORF Transcript_6078/g.18172 Transcript_6078/m.18172 type:complete len:249 (-) Transcript_6078:13-759(-)